MSQESSTSSPSPSLQSQQLKRRRSNHPPPQRLSWPAGSGITNNNKAGKRRRNGSDNTAADTNTSGLWVEKFFPTSSSDLCVAPKKVKEIREWLAAAVTTTRHTAKKLLVLVGSPGIGKSTAVRVLCDEKDLSILQWNESFVPRTRGSAPSGDSGSSSFSVEQSSAMDSFREFLQQSAVGFRSLDFIFNHHHAKDNNNAAKHRTKQSQTDPIILLEELPNLYSPDAEAKFRTIMEEHLLRTHVPTVLIFSDVSEGRHRPQDLERLIDPKLLYNPDMTTILQIHPVTKPKMKRVLEQVARKQGGDITKTLLEELHLQSGGDLRHAIMNLQLLSTGLEKKTMPKAASAASNERDVKLSTFHSLGKLLYAKRTQTVEEGHSVLAFDPEAILERSDLGVGGSLRFLEYHSAAFFEDITDLSDAFECFSDAATLLEPSVTQVSSLHTPLKTSGHYDDVI
jgi:cell cycle checkpoint protein